MSARAAVPVRTPPVVLAPAQRATAHMAASILLDYPSTTRRSQYGAVSDCLPSLPAAIADELAAFLAGPGRWPQQELEAHFTAIFDLKRKCCPYLSYYATGDTRKRGMALVRFIEAYRAAGWEVAADELPDYLPMVLEFSAKSDSPIAGELLASHRDGIEVLRTALESFDSPYALVVAAVCRSLPEIDDETRQRYRKLIDEGPPAETVGLTFVGALAPYSQARALGQVARA
ncbi:MAG: nitrate reductase molybdenum cofactor assembly chaperone [Terrimesophilobacter sp.]